MVLSVSVGGMGLPEHARVEIPETLGLRVAQVFARQIHGALEIKSNESK